MVDAAKEVQLFRSSFSTDWKGEFGRAAGDYKKSANEKRKYKALPELGDIYAIINFCGHELTKCNYK